MVLPFIQQQKTSNIMLGTLKARPGAGKTIMGVYLASLMKQKTLIMLNNTALIEQWISSDVRPGRSEEQWLNLILKKADTV